MITRIKVHQSRNQMSHSDDILNFLVIIMVLVDVSLLSYFFNICFCFSIVNQSMFIASIRPYFLKHDIKGSLKK